MKTNIHKYSELDFTWEGVSRLTAMRNAIADLRKRSDCEEWGTRVKNGKGQLIRCSLMDSGKSRIWPCTEWMPIDKLIYFIRNFSL